MNEPGRGAEVILEGRARGKASDELGEEGPPTRKSKGLLSKILIGLGILVAQAAFAYALMMFVVMPAAEKRVSAAKVKEAEAQPAKQGEKKAGKSETPGSQSLADMRIESMFTIEDLVINPAFSGGERYLVLSLVFISDTKETQKEIEQKLPLIQDMLNTRLSQKGVWWYSNSENREALREEIRVAVNELLRTGKVTRVLFTKYVIQ
jgi:flagellar FliL protein